MAAAVLRMAAAVLHMAAAVLRMAAAVRHMAAAAVHKDRGAVHMDRRAHRKAAAPVAEQEQEQKLVLVPDLLAFRMHPRESVRRKDLELARISAAH
jgi:hypothetical protein